MEANLRVRNRHKEPPTTCSPAIATKCNYLTNCITLVVQEIQKSTSTSNTTTTTTTTSPVTRNLNSRRHHHRQQHHTKLHRRQQQQLISIMLLALNICTWALLVQLLSPPVINASSSSSSNNNNSTSLASTNHDSVRHTSSHGHSSDRHQPSEIQFSGRKLVKLDPSSSNIRSLNHVPTGAAAAVAQASRFHNQSSTISDLTSSNGKTGDIQAHQKKGLFEKICIGTSNKISVQSNKTDHYQNLVERYRNCTYVIGNLEITWLKDSPDRQLDLSFLESIREITGHLLIAYVDVEKIRMPNLQIIRGRDLFPLKRTSETKKDDEKDELAVLLMFNELRSLELPNLREILAGSVASINNRNLCHLRTIDWDEILNPPYRTIFGYNGTEPNCPVCHKECNGNCWGEGPDMCQKFSKTNCAPQCNQGRCFGSEPRECCHLFCAGGCTGPKQTDCLACKNFYDDGECIQECPSMQKYNPSKFSWEPNPKGKYAYGASCVRECPDHLLRDNGACVRTCPPNKRSLNGECQSCSGPCPKECQGDVIHSGNIDRFVNCTIIEGSISILETSFSGFAEILPNNSIGARHLPMHPRSLSALKNVREITGYLNIQANHPDFTDLSYLRKLEIIGARQTIDMLYALTVIKTSLRSLNLRSLKKIKSGKVTIEENRHLCFEDTDKWLRANITKAEDLVIRNNGDQLECEALGLQCHAQCGPGGCWGPGSDECLSCNNYKFEDFCVVDCESTTRLGHSSFDAGNRTCQRCHSECASGCSGTQSSNCFQCKNVKDGPYCVAECPNHKFNNSGTCAECDKGCVGGCTGPSSYLRQGGCNSCGKIVLREAGNSTHQQHGDGGSDRCVGAEESCPEGYYTDVIKKVTGKAVCRKCHSRCKSCTGMGTHQSVCVCAKFLAGEQCEETCPRDFYADKQSRHCFKCSPECNGCNGPTEMDCKSCRVYRIYPDGYKPQLALGSDGRPMAGGVRFNCTAHCPPEKPHRISDSNLLDPYCSEDPGNDIDSPQGLVRVVSIGSSSFFLMVIISASVMLCISVYRCQIEKNKTVKLTLRLSGLDDEEPLKQSNMKPNLSSLISIKETELRKGRVLGSGFGGTVYIGLWSPEGKKSRPVAIKVLRDNNMNKEFLDEAYIMASVQHPNLVSLLAVCMTPENLMLVTPLIPLGCLLAYVRSNKSQIGSKNLLEWSKQIAKGMAYLEERRMVHRDLALRNVLLQTSGKAMISDFGLAKLLEVNQSEYHSGGGRLPIKWLAPECISERKFTHKSDVWAFGVTVWELLSFGKNPWEEIEAKDLHKEIVKGARLPHLEGVTAEVHKELLSCWFPNPENRPSFKDLADKFVNFARDPERYLHFNTQSIENWDRHELGRTSESGDNSVFGDNLIDRNSLLIDEELPGQRRALPDLITDSFSTARNGRLDLNGFELRHHSESDGINASSPTVKKIGMFQGHAYRSTEEDVFSSFPPPRDLNNNSNNNNNSRNHNSNSSSNHSSNSNFPFATGSNRDEQQQPIDADNYLLPTPPCSKEEKFNKFIATRECSTSTRKMPASPLTRDPPHSAGLIGVSNEEYFLSRSNYFSAGSTTNASSGHIPHSLV